MNDLTLTGVSVGTERRGMRTAARITADRILTAELTASIQQQTLVYIYNQNYTGNDILCLFQSPTINAIHNVRESTFVLSDKFS